MLQKKSNIVAQHDRKTETNSSLTGKTKIVSMFFCALRHPVRYKVKLPLFADVVFLIVLMTCMIIGFWDAQKKDREKERFENWGVDGDDKKIPI